MNIAGSHQFIHNRKREPGILDNQVRVSTPENIAFQYEVVGPSRRLVAYLLDVFFTLIAFVILTFGATILFGLLRTLARGTALVPAIDVLGQLAMAFYLVGAFISIWFYGAYMETWYNGQTFGKMLTNIRALSTDGSAIDGVQATLRNFFRLLDVSPFLPLSLVFGTDVQFIVPIFAFGLISMTFSRRYQRIGDLVANTMVVDEAKIWTHELAKFEDKRVMELAELIPDDFVTTPGLAKALAEYVDRRRFLSFQRVSEVAGHIGRPLLNRFGLANDTDTDLLLCALYYKTFVHEREKSDNPFRVDRNVNSHRPFGTGFRPLPNVPDVESVGTTGPPPVIAEQVEATG